MIIVEHYTSLIKSVCDMKEVLSVGKSGGEELPQQNESDVDIFVFCSGIPDIQTRQAAIGKLGTVVSNMRLSESKGRFWGVCDFITLDGTEICLMYFTISDMNDEIDFVLNGTRLDREGEYFYPTGRCATLLSMHVVCDKNGYIFAMKEKLSVYPQSLAEALCKHHIGKINNAEDFDRAVLRQDVLFYHSTLERAIDHFLQAMFALNFCFFPSRKRTFQFIEQFALKPRHCAERLIEVIELGARPETLAQSYETWRMLCEELAAMKVRP